jgi:hypothetical protein
MIIDVSFSLSELQSSHCVEKVWCTPKLLKRPKSGFHNETMEKGKTHGTLIITWHFEGRRACWSSRMGLRQTHKQKFKMKSTCVTNDRG